MSFSYINRENTLQAITSESFDLLVIGGGITGVGIALDAASRGLRTVLLEKNDFAYGTSSRSTKLIHGGLRYLKQFEFALVKEVGSERAIVHRLAPHLVVPEKMLLPLREGRGFGSLLTSFGLWLYDWLAGVKPADQRRMLTRKQTLRREPLMSREGVKGGGLYAEYRTDDARLTIEIAKTAVAHGAHLLNYARVEKFIYEGSDVTGVEGRDTLTSAVFKVRATCVVNACGPWVDELRTADKSKSGKSLHLTKGVHIVVPYERFPVQQSIYFDVADGRMIFAIPRGRCTYIGTTDTDYTNDCDSVNVSRVDVNYLLAAVNETFPTVQLVVADVESSWAGLRPLIHEDGKSASELSRKDEIFESPSGLLSIAGGKLTGYRKMAERVVNLVIKKYFSERSLKKCYTHKIKLCDGGLINLRAVKEHRRLMRKNLAALRVDEQVSNNLVHLYGRRSEEVYAALRKYLLEGIEPELALVRAELEYCVANECVLTATDFFIRRSGMLFFDIARLRNTRDFVLGQLQSTLHWSDERRKQEAMALDDAVERATQFQ